MRQSMSKQGRWFAVGALAVAAVAFGVITAGGIGQNLVYYWSPSDLRSAGEKAYGASIRLGGQVKPGSVKASAGSSELQFDVTDLKNEVHVRSTGMPPQMFREGIGVVVEGTMTRQGFFESQRLMVSHNNEYRAPGDPYKTDTKSLMRTTEALGGEQPGKGPVDSATR